MLQAPVPWDVNAAPSGLRVCGGCLQEYILGCHSMGVNGCTFITLYGPNGVVVTASADGTLRVWEPFDPTLKVLWRLVLVAASRPTLAFGRRCSGPYACGLARFQEPCLQVLTAHTSSVTSVVRGTGVLVSASTDGTLIVWAPSKGRELALYPWFHPCLTLHFGKMFVHGARRGTLVLLGEGGWGAGRDEVVRWVCVCVCGGGGAVQWGPYLVHDNSTRSPARLLRRRPLTPHPVPLLSSPPPPRLKPLPSLPPLLVVQLGYSLGCCGV
jgi:hypothetical protein